MDLQLPHEAAADRPHLLSAISNEMVRRYKDQFGRGPTKVRTDWAGPDALIVTLEATLTPPERRLRELERLRELRMLFQNAELAAFCEPIERLTDRKVRAFVSGIDIEADLAAEMFVLHPLGYDGPSRADTA